MVYAPFLGLLVGIIYGAFIGAVLKAPKPKTFADGGTASRDRNENKVQHQYLSLQELLENRQQAILESNFYWNSVKYIYLIWLIILVIGAILTYMTILPRSALSIWAILGLVLNFALLQKKQIELFESFIPHIILFYQDRIPWKYLDFLNCATNRIYLQKVGNAYMFIHPLLLNYFADEFVSEA
jgi:hypothetical protein